VALRVQYTSPPDITVSGNRPMAAKTSARTKMFAVFATLRLRMSRSCCMLLSASKISAPDGRFE
jgi:hypothetical protein